jgi:hypothetical protein
VNENPDLSRLVTDAEHAHSRAEAGLRAAIDGIETSMDRLNNLGRVAAIARAVRAETERDRLRALLDQAGGDPAAAEIARLRAELAEARAVGRCGAHPRALLAGHDGPEPTCTLPAEHAGWHKDATTGAEWTPEPVAIEYRVEYLTETATWRWCVLDYGEVRTPATVLSALAHVRASNPGDKFRAATRALPPFRPVADEQLAAMAAIDAATTTPGEDTTHA